ncbi:CIC11C00000004044 [Sungouiella intermedia]|uniref:tRNA N(3)-methylcytidine methyltransferase n=1 Tax=Sungouiella intermedia TaxID=45354 RepID=A0A1L0BE73_9ASCO|nr:CIC11C00000003050 [[Candida] intermedia]SGZ52493.1 CIC11C00000004044 [[Candida] intermedia]
MTEQVKETKPDLDTRIGKDSPFTFGQRFLTDDKDVFDHNAWDHVEWGDEQVEQAKELIAKQYELPVKDFDKKLYNANPAKFWDIFYKNNRENFFKDRKWLQIEFPSLYKVTAEDYDKPVTILEIGCGAGNTFYPILNQNKNPNLKIVGCDYLKVAVDLVKSNEEFEANHEKGVAFSSVWDLANPEGNVPEDLEPNSVDIVIMVFVFSALHPDQWKQAVANLQKVLKPGGEILFRDYGRYDLAQVRFKKGRLLDDNFYIRGDGTRVYFFTEEELREIFCTEGPFTEEKIGTDRRLLVNRKKQLKMYRIWLQGVFRKPE